ncbi:MAG TPA: polysaccharide biosynthesis/export family protein [Pyrinomonadaceae bacterium]|nr:polysaccharide biosynthesis/export family protein [Pyrinomonadaceae bacterium]
MKRKEKGEMYLRLFLAGKGALRAAGIAALMLLAYSVGAAQTAGALAAAPAGDGAGSRAGEPYRIGPGDVLEVRVFNRPQLSREAVRVEGDGSIRMPLIEGGVRAACLTEAELSQEIARRYLRYLKNPQVDIFLKEFNSAPVAVLGAVTSPGRFQLQRRVRLLEILSFAGGPTERAGRNIQVVHSELPLACAAGGGEVNGAGEASVVSSFRLSETLLGDAAANPYVRPGDIVTVTEAEQAYVVGNVLKPSMIPLKERVTISQAIAMAGGTLPDTQSERVRVVRQAPGGAKTEIIVDLKAISKRRAEDVALQPNDIVEVPTASGKRFLRTLLGSAVPSAARLPVQIIR